MRWLELIDTSVTRIANETRCVAVAVTQTVAINKTTSAQNRLIARGRLSPMGILNAQAKFWSRVKVVLLLAKLAMNSKERF